MMNYSLKQIADIVGGTVVGNPEVIVHGIAIDSREIKPTDIFVPIKGEKVNGHDFVSSLGEIGVKASFWQASEADIPTNMNCVVVDDPVLAIQQLATDYRRTLKTIIIGVTGSSGKTSTKDLISSVLQSKYTVHKTQGNQNNEIGVPRTLLSIDDEEIAVIEMGISDFGEMDQLVNMVLPNYTVITNIAPAHIMNFKTIDNIVKEKCHINAKLGNGKCFYAKEAYGLDQYLPSMGLINAPSSYGYNNNAKLYVEEYSFTELGMRFKTNLFDKSFDLPLLGKHQILNSLAAISVGIELGLTYQQIYDGLRNVKLTPHRNELHVYDKVTIIDDTYNSNPESLLASLELLSEYDSTYCKYAVLGDMLELGDNSEQFHSDIANKIDFAKFNNTFLYGEMMGYLAKTIESQNKQVVYYADREKLVNDIYEVININFLSNKKSIILFKASNGLRFFNLIEALEEML